MRIFRICLVVLSLTIGLSAAESSFSGTWKFNPAKGHLTPPVPKSQIVHIDADDENFKFSQESVNEKDEQMKTSYEAKFDGKEYSVTGDPGTSVSLKRVNNRHMKVTEKKGGKITAKYDVTVSADGKTTTVNYLDYSQGKKPLEGSAIYDKE
jgi:hypothetical protein